MAIFDFYHYYVGKHKSKKNYMLHISDCPCAPLPQNRKYIGNGYTIEEAILKTKEMFPNINNIKPCSKCLGDMEM